MAFITLRMVFVLAWTICDANNLTCQLLLSSSIVCQLLLSFVCCMCTGLVTWLNQLSDTVIRCDTTEKVAMEWPPWHFGFMPLPSVALRSGASFV